MSPTTHQYKDLIATTIKAKMYVFLLGIFVFGISLGTFFAITKINPFAGAVNSARKVAAAVRFSPPEGAKTNLNLEKISLYNAKIASPSLLPNTNIYQNTIVITPTPVPQEGEISAIMSGQVTHTGNTYIVKEGDSLATIAQEVYGDSNAWTVIAKANNLNSPNQIEVGMTLKIPR
jgi:nucleoid-associated protein YgaU